ncbi:MAG: hypothetical protein ACRDGS_12695, partial [Chloroflexota bacterium]
MKVMLGVLAVIAGLLQTTLSGSSANAAHIAAPRQARAGASVAIPGSPGWFCVSGAGSRLEVVDRGASSTRVIWSHSVSFPVTALFAPGPHGLCSGRAGGLRGGAGAFFAFSVRGSSVTSDIIGHKSGVVSADDGIRMSRSTVAVVRHKDTRHTGSIPYRIAVRFQLKSGHFVKGASVHQPDLEVAAYPHPNGVIKTRSGDTALIKLQVATTQLQQDRGLMYIRSMDA